MKAVVLTDWGGVDKFTSQDVDKPSIEPDEVLIQVKAFGINPADYKTRGGTTPYAKAYSSPIILGWDAAGEVVEVGEAVSRFVVGDAVYGMINFPKAGQRLCRICSCS